MTDATAEPRFAITLESCAPNYPEWLRLLSENGITRTQVTFPDDDDLRYPEFRYVGTRAALLVMLRVGYQEGEAFLDEHAESADAKQ